MSAKLIWMSDLHFVAEGRVQGHDPRVRVDAAIAHIAAHHADAAGCIISGDLVDRGTAEDYAALAQRLSDCPVPLYPMVGNHDNRQLLRQHIALPDDAMPAFVQYALPFADGLAVCLDTQKTGSDAGEVCAIRMAWLRGILDGHAGPVYLFMHHPPLALGLPMQDQDRMENGDMFLDAIAAYPQIKMMFIGHVHRPITGTVRGIPYATMRSVLYQAPPPMPAWDWDSFKPAQEPPALGILQFADGDVRLQYDQFCDFAVGGA